MTYYDFQTDVTLSSSRGLIRFRHQKYLATLIYIHLQQLVYAT